ncbi:hypothetical protein [Sandaracinus amylolyticus]|uniref:hypothetical protein n=1 Tax=Sandaracinus amylolyticus TaxID=927083 RepID=UPI001F346C0D|nr:hypothetical protein [Sandaracinus amylolyticus]UJR84258.1 Hypothetical protein I5071_63350 [Sandaracinus amylolyticus]
MKTAHHAILVAVALSIVAPASAHARSLIVTSGEHRCSLTEGTVHCEGWRGRDTCEPEIHDFDVALPEPAVAIDAGGPLTCALTRSGSVFCWGWPESSDLVDRADTCPASELTPREVVGVRGRASAIAMAQGRVCALLTDTTVSCWDASSTPIDAAAADAMRVVRDDARPLDRVRTVTAFLGGACAIDADAALWCWGENQEVLPACGDSSPCAARRMPLELVPDALRCGPTGCCAIAADRALECWGPTQDDARVLVRDNPAWIDLTLDEEGACVATRDAVDCNGGLRIRRRASIWDGFRLRRGEIVGLHGQDGAVCVSTTGAPVCWSASVRDRGLDGVTPRVARTHWRLEPGERALRTRIDPVRCVDHSMLDEPPPTLDARLTRRGLRIRVSQLVYNCGHAPPIDARLRVDGSIELGIGDLPHRAPLTRCDCLYDFVVWIHDPPAGAREIVFGGDDGAPPVRATIQR